MVVERASSLRAAEERLRLAEAQLGLGFWSWERASNEVAWSLGLYDLLGLEAGTVQPSLSLLETLVHPRDRLRFEEAASLATDDRQRSRRIRIIRPDGQLRWLMSIAQTSFDRDGQIVRVLAVVHDITEREELRRNHAADRAVIGIVTELLQLAVWCADANGRLLDIVEPPRDDTHDTEAVTSTWRDMVHPDDLARIAEVWRDAVSRRARYEFTPRLRNRDGTYRTTRSIGLPLDRASTGDELQMAGISLPDGRPLPNSVAPVSSDADMLTPAQVRAGRGYLGWSADDLAERANISVSTVRRLESEAAQRPSVESLRQIRLAFERAGLTLGRSPDGRASISGPA